MARPRRAPSGWPAKQRGERLRAASAAHRVPHPKDPVIAHRPRRVADVGLHAGEPPEAAKEQNLENWIAERAVRKRTPRGW